MPAAQPGETDGDNRLSEVERAILALEHAWWK
jgi:hypothetical protein